MTEEYGIKVNNTTNCNKSISEDIIKKVKKYFLEKSWTCPGKKDLAIVKGKSPKLKEDMLLIK